MVLTYTRHPPPGWTGHSGRIDAALIADEAPLSETAFVCGSNGFVEASAGLLLDTGIGPRRIRTERFGPTG